MYANFKYSDEFMLATIRDGQQRNYILHKSSALLAMDAAWLLNPSGKSQAADHLANAEETSERFAPVGYGCMLVSFDEKTVYSYQVYKDISRLTLHDSGFYGGAAPTWMDWPRLIEDAFAMGCITDAIYESQDSGGHLRLSLPSDVRSRRTSAMRFVTKEKPEGFDALGLEFSPPGWSIRHEHVNTRSPQVGRTHVNDNLTKLRAAVAPVGDWMQMQAA